jgi:hypothetical protein
MGWSTKGYSLIIWRALINVIINSFTTRKKWDKSPHYVYLKEYFIVLKRKVNRPIRLALIYFIYF